MFDWKKSVDIIYVKIFGDFNTTVPLQAGFVL